MGCSPSRVTPPGDVHMGECTLRSTEQPAKLAYAARIHPVPGKDQDRYVLNVEGRSALVVGIFDGHSVHSQLDGQRHAESAAHELPRALWKRARAHLGGRFTDGADLLALSRLSSAKRMEELMKLYPPAEGESARASAGGASGLAAAAAAAFDGYQEGIEQRYGRDVAAAILAEKAKLEAEVGEELPVELPQEGGTTATLLLVHPRGVFAAWVGDSRAVAGLRRAEGGGDWSALALTADHNARDPAERARLLDAGGKTGAEGTAHCDHVFVAGAEGSLKVTRSLGDSPFHKGRAVSSTPGAVHVPFTPELTFMIVASDGIWDHLTDDEAVQLVGKALAGEEVWGAEAAARASDALVQEVLRIATAEATDENPHGAAPARPLKHRASSTPLDDMSVAVVLRRGDDAAASRGAGAPTSVTHRVM